MNNWTETYLNEVRIFGEAGNLLLKRGNADDWDKLERDDFAEYVANWAASGDVLMTRVDPYWHEEGRSIGSLWASVRSQFSLADHDYWDEISHTKLRVHMQQLVGIISSAASYGPPLQGPPPPDGIGVPRCHFHRRQVTPVQEMVFVAMPFKPVKICDAVHSVLRIVCDHALGRNKLKCVRADDLTGHDVMQDVYESIARCGTVVVDTSGMNANVFIELGMAITLGKPLILITRDELDTIPFDLRRFRHFDYTHERAGLEGLARNVARALSDIHRIKTCVGNEDWGQYVSGVDILPQRNRVRLSQMQAGKRLGNIQPTD